LGAGLGQAPARQASLSAGLGVETPCTTLNKVCSSGLKSIVFGSQSIALGHTHTVVTGGFESMSKAPFLLFNTRKGTGFGHQQLYDAISYDGLQDAFNKMPMGNCAEKTADDFKITREAQDQYCKLSYKRHIDAIKSGLLKDEIVNIKIKDKKAEEDFNEDEEWKRYKEDKIGSLAPAFSKTGTITAANASKINDGACSLSTPFLII
jgi:acetyl-CoA C-acetyltransferase